MSTNTQGYAIRRNSTCGDEEVKCHQTWENDLAVTMACCPQNSHCNNSGQPNDICCPNGLNCTKEIESKPATCADQRWNLYDKDGEFCCEHDQSGYFIENSIWVGCYTDASDVDGNYIGLPILSTGEMRFNPRPIRLLTSFARFAIHPNRKIQYICIYRDIDIDIDINVGGRLNRRLTHQHGRHRRWYRRRRRRRRCHPHRAILPAAIAKTSRSTIHTALASLSIYHRGELPPPKRARGAKPQARRSRARIPAAARISRVPGARPRSLQPEPAAVVARSRPPTILAASQQPTMLVPLSIRIHPCANLLRSAAARATDRPQFSARL